MKKNRRREEEEGKGRESERAARRNSPFFSEPSTPISFCCLLFFPFIRKAFAPSRAFSFVIQKDGRDESARHGRGEASENEKEKRKRERQREMQEKGEPRREELTSSLCPSFVLPLSFKAEDEKKRKRIMIS